MTAHSRAPDANSTPGVSRRRVVSTFAATTAVAWVAPSVLRLDTIAAAVGSEAPPAVTGDATLGTLVAGETLRPESVQYSSNSQFWVFDEQSQTLTTPQTTQSGMVLPTGVEICSHLVHWSPAVGTTTVSGSVAFSGTIVGYDWGDAQLSATDAQWGIAGVNYGTTLRRMEWPGNDDLTFTLPGSLAIFMRANAAFVDQIRIYVVY